MCSHSLGCIQLDIYQHLRFLFMITSVRKSVYIKMSYIFLIYRIASKVDTLYNIHIRRYEIKKNLFIPVEPSSLLFMRSYWAHKQTNIQLLSLNVETPWHQIKKIPLTTQNIKILRQTRCTWKHAFVRVFTKSSWIYPPNKQRNTAMITSSASVKRGKMFDYMCFAS